jgi:phage terminase small subunit
MKLTPKRQRFVQEYLVDLNATQAAIRAGYSAGAARSQGHRMMTNADIRKNIGVAMERRAERTGITADRVLRELALIGFANIADYLDTDDSGHPRIRFDGLSRDQMAAIKEVKSENRGYGRRLQFKLNDKLTALVAMGRHLDCVAAADDDRRYLDDSSDDCQ